MPKPKGDLHVRWTIYVDARIAAVIENSLIDPKTGKPSYGKRQKLIDRLLRDYIDNNNLMEFN